jgi:drug/metabolite transporter (DMT)-like permease
MFLLVKVMEGTADAFTLVFYRSLVQITISLSAIIQNGENPLGPAGEFTRFWLLVRGGFGAGAVIAWFFGIQILPLPDAVTLQFTTPPFAAIFAVCLAGEKWLRLDMIGAAVCLAGVALIAHPTWLFGHHEVDHAVATDGEDPMTKAFAVGVTEAGAAMAGIAYVSVRLIGHRASANVMVLYYGCLSIPIVLVGSRWLLGKWSVWGDDFFTPWDYFVSEGKSYFCIGCREKLTLGAARCKQFQMLLLTGFAGYGGQYFTNLGLQRESAATVSICYPLCIISLALCFFIV